MHCKHEWGKKYRYWHTNNGGFMGEMFTKQKLQGSRPVWLQECAICHTTKHTTRKVRPTPLAPDRAKRAEKSEHSASGRSKNGAAGKA